MHGSRKRWIIVLSVVLLASLAWYAFLFASGLGLTPHGSDTRFGWHGDAAAAVLPALFAKGSFGILWYVFPVWMLLLFPQLRKLEATRRSAVFSSLSWGLVTFLIVLAVYTLTPNAVFLVNGESFYRQMMTPGALLLLSCCLTAFFPIQDANVRLANVQGAISEEKIHKSHIDSSPLANERR